MNFFFWKLKKNVFYNLQWSLLVLTLSNAILSKNVHQFDKLDSNCNFWKAPYLILKIFIVGCNCESVKFWFKSWRSNLKLSQIICKSHIWSK